MRRAASTAAGRRRGRGRGRDRGRVGGFDGCRGRGRVRGLDDELGLHAWRSKISRGGFVSERLVTVGGVGGQTVSIVVEPGMVLEYPSRK